MLLERSRTFPFFSVVPRCTWQMAAGEPVWQLSDTVCMKETSNGADIFQGICVHPVPLPANGHLADGAGDFKTMR